jgi:hypothetical protein
MSEQTQGPEGPTEGVSSNLSSSENQQAGTNTLTPEPGTAGAAGAPHFVAPIVAAAEIAARQAHETASKFGCGALVIIFDATGAYQFRTDGQVNVTNVIGILHRITLGLHSAAANQTPFSAPNTPNRG